MDLVVNDVFNDKQLIRTAARNRGVEESSLRYRLCLIRRHQSSTVDLNKENLMTCAIESVRNGMKIKMAAAAYALPPSTLRDRLNG